MYSNQVKHFSYSQKHNDDIHEQMSTLKFHNHNLNEQIASQVEQLRRQAELAVKAHTIARLRRNVTVDRDASLGGIVRSLAGRWRTPAQSSAGWRRAPLGSSLDPGKVAIQGAVLECAYFFDCLCFLFEFAPHHRVGKQERYV